MRRSGPAASPRGDTLALRVRGRAHHPLSESTLVVGCVPEHEAGSCCAACAIEPRSYWTVPPPRRDAAQAAARESLEEALAEVTVGSLLSVVHVLHRGAGHVFFRASLPAPRYGVGAESLEVELWSRLGFPGTTSPSRSTGLTLRRYSRTGGRPRAASLHDHRPGLRRLPGLIHPRTRGRGTMASEFARDAATSRARRSR